MSTNSQDYEDDYITVKLNGRRYEVQFGTEPVKYGTRKPKRRLRLSHLDDPASPSAGDVVYSSEDYFRLTIDQRKGEYTMEFNPDPHPNPGETRSLMLIQCKQPPCWP
jgi:hypothetical protein